MDKSLLIIFAKNPELGKVKTRLAATLGNEVALAVYFQLLNKTRQETESLTVDKVVYYSNYVEHGDLWDDNIYAKAAQQGDDLGQRMQNAFTQAFANGYERVCLCVCLCGEREGGRKKEESREEGNPCSPPSTLSSSSLSI